MLWITTGDNLVGRVPQDLASTGGKVLRVTRDGAPAPDNPTAWPRPADPRLMDTLGEVLIAQHQYARAAEVLAKAVARAPQLGSARYHLALALSLDGRRDEARELLKSLLGNDQPFSERAEAQSLLAQIGS